MHTTVPDSTGREGRACTRSRAHAHQEASARIRRGTPSERLPEDSDPAQRDSEAVPSGQGGREAMQAREAAEAGPGQWVAGPGGISSCRQGCRGRPARRPGLGLQDPHPGPAATGHTSSPHSSRGSCGTEKCLSHCSDGLCYFYVQGWIKIAV